MTTKRKKLDPHTLRWAARQLRREAKALSVCADGQRDIGYLDPADALEARAGELSTMARVLLHKARELEQKPRKP